MHILISLYFNAPLGGLQENILSTVVYCMKNNHTVTVLCKEGLFQQKLTQIGIEVITSDFSILNYRHTLEKILKLNADKPIDLLHSHPFASRALSLVIAKILGIPLVLTVHDEYTDRLEHYSEQFAAIFTVSEGIRDYVCQFAPLMNKHQVMVVHNGIDTDFYKPGAKFPAAAQQEKIHISLVSRLDNDRKFVIEVFYSILQFVEQHYQGKVIWTIIGQGEFQAKMEKDFKSLVIDEYRVNFTGWKEGNELLAAYRNSDIIVGPGRCALEAMSCGKPVIAVGSRGYVGLINETTYLEGIYSNFCGVASKKNAYSVSRVENDIAKVMDSPALREKLGMLGRSIVDNFFNQELVNKNLLVYYQALSLKDDKKPIAKTPIEHFLEMKLTDIIIRKIAANKFKFEVVCTDHVDTVFAWYIYKNSVIIDKIWYKAENFTLYCFKEQGVFSIKCFMKNKAQQINFMCGEVSVQALDCV